MTIISQNSRNFFLKIVYFPSILLFFLTTPVIIPGVSTAGGLYLNEFGTPSMGVAGAGANA